MAPKRKHPASSTAPRRSSRLSALPAAPHPEPRKAKKAKTEPEPRKTAKAKTGSGEGAKLPEGTRTIIIERCTQCNSFKTRAIQVKEGLEGKLAGISVVVNPEKPRRGCFEIREQDGEVFVSLLGMKRPFEAMRALDMDKVIEDIVAQIQG